MATPSKHVQPSPLRQAIAALANRPQGVTNRELQDTFGVTPKQADSGLTAATVAREVCKQAHPQDPKHRLHFFTSQSAATAWAAGPAPVSEKRRPDKPKEKAPQGHAWRPTALAKSLPAPVPAIVTAGPSKMAATAPCEPVTGPKITRGPSPVFGIAARYYVDPATVSGPFTLAGIGRDVQTGRAWGAPA